MLTASCHCGAVRLEIARNRENCRSAIIQYAADMELYGPITRENRFASFVHPTLSQPTYGVTEPLSFIIAKSAVALRITKV